MRKELQIEPKLWDNKMVGFGDYHYVNKTNEGDMPITGFVVAKAHITLYFTVQGLDPYNDLLLNLGKYRRGKVCLYISNMNSIDEDALTILIHQYYADIESSKYK